VVLAVKLDEVLEEDVATTEEDDAKLEEDEDVEVTAVVEISDVSEVELWVLEIDGVVDVTGVEPEVLEVP